jgi:uncharacterized membrane protein SpoIIM required for sporulation
MESIPISLKHIENIGWDILPISIQVAVQITDGLIIFGRNTIFFKLFNGLLIKRFPVFLCRFGKLDFACCIFNEITSSGNHLLVFDCLSEV